MADADAQQKMFRIITGYWCSQIVGTLARLGIPDCMVIGAHDAGSIAERAGCDAQGTLRLLRAAAALGVAEQDADGKFSLTSLGRTLLSNEPHSMRDMAAALTAPGHWLPWGRLDEAVRRNERQTTAALGCEIFDYFVREPAEGRAFDGAMADLSAFDAESVAAVLDTSDVQFAVDVGGGRGTILAALMKRNPGLRGAVLELPHVVPTATATIAERDLADRCAIIAGDFFDSVPAADLHVLKNVLHDWDDKQSIRILTNCATALRDGGRVVLVEAVLPDDGSESLAPFLDMVMLVLTPGRERTAREYQELLGAAGLGQTRIIKTHSPMQVIEARRPT